MDEQIFETCLQKWEPLLAEMNIPLSTWFKRKIDHMDPDWKTNMSRFSLHLQREKNWGADFNALTDEIGDVYLICTPQQCKKIRHLLSRYRGVMRFLGISIPLEKIVSKEDLHLFRRILAFESIRDQGDDTRDLILSLEAIYKRGKEVGIDTVSCIEEIQKISSPVDKFGWGSMQDVLGGQKGTSPAKESFPCLSNPKQKSK